MKKARRYAKKTQTAMAHTLDGERTSLLLDMDCATLKNRVSTSRFATQSRQNTAAKAWLATAILGENANT